MKKVFDVYKFIDNMSRNQVSYDEIIQSLDFWAKKCHGLTEEEMIYNHGCSASDEWMIEVKE